MRYLLLIILSLCLGFSGNARAEAEGKFNPKLNFGSPMDHKTYLQLQEQNATWYPKDGIEQINVEDPVMSEAIRALIIDLSLEEPLLPKSRRDLDPQEIQRVRDRARSINFVIAVRRPDDTEDIDQDMALVHECSSWGNTVFYVGVLSPDAESMPEILLRVVDTLKAKDFHDSKQRYCEDQQRKDQEALNARIERARNQRQKK